MQPPSTSSFQAYLQSELVRRCKASPSYSLRAFSRSLGIQSSFLSKILNGKRAVTFKTIDRLTPKLGLSPQDISHFKASLVGLSLSTEDTQYSQLSMDAFNVISDWYHFAILELATTEQFKWEGRWIAARLGIAPVQVADALSRMERLGLIQKKGPNYIVRSGQNTTLNLGKTEPALKRLQCQVLEKAIEAMDQIPIELRDQTTMTMAIDSALLPEAKRRITTFRRELCAFLQKKRKTNAVYHLSISLYPITKELKTRRKTHEKLH